MSLPRLILRPVHLKPSTSRLFPSRTRTCRSFHASGFDAGIKILFCGSDDFSLTSLKALQAVKEATGDEVIESIDVVLKYEKPSGRGLKEQRPNPVRKFANSKCMSIYTLDAEQFNDWKPPHAVDLIVAVSFGLFIPSRILEYARFGGLNVHPSFLPKYWGASPIQHAIINDDKTTGVVVQTLHPSKFDAGRIIAKSDPVDINIDIDIKPRTFPPPTTDPESPYQKLESKLAEVGAKLLTGVIENQHYDHVVQSKLPEITTGERRKHARILTTEDSRILLGEMTAREVFLRSLVFDNLFCFRHKVKGSRSKPPVRLTMGPFRLPTPDEYEKRLKLIRGQWIYLPDSSEDGKIEKKKPGSVALQVMPGEWVCFENSTSAGKTKQNAKGWEQMDRKHVQLISQLPEDGEEEEEFVYDDR
ncbi:Methionyl-tRNA formyltransferase [Orbilia javanica]|uniref:methionyl-tRNA formyltransferase n=1 Tax=Orbilia javanica TaxID=47235 RepID=A0AAN8MGV9_9PEZI